jgi:ubiquitin carboxyl-terminal hydrolase 35/38
LYNFRFTREILSSQIETDFFHKVQLLIALLVHSERPELDPKSFLAAIRPPDFQPGYQQDSSEFLGYLLDKLHEHEKKIMAGEGDTEQEENKDIVIELKQPMVQEENWDDEVVPETGGIKKFATLEDLSTDEVDLKADQVNEAANAVNFLKMQNKVIDNTLKLNQQTLIQKVFGGKVSTTYQCYVCQSKNIHIDAFRDLQLAFPEPDSNLAKSIDSYSVQYLLDYYCSSEKLEGEFLIYFYRKVPF